MAQIEIKNLTFKYAMADSSCLKNVSLNIENGDFVVVCGKSGCGKPFYNIPPITSVIKPAN